ncbi:dihydrofolate reductase family protein [Nocardia cyriacigeorgica]|uniref:dihydrofolate reductase family protein n=1 Tax=Nocardia cyriacigeorgica TaxID=135487 RepID=UPI00031E6B2C|nr:dihydrofolate reductase family protein [Nocardia cyriacigeorgica]MBF6321253.1 dihydrofolate reductase [Nocardia cyriacigeorgica]MBF6495052.1 dihydrofolate reductase [Nocardia cyriacigeorgica]TLF53485.1 dihydrofolate reductase [Nocardia cyriacigeorgica]
MTTRYYTATSLDGYIADQNNSLDWLMAVADADTATSDVDDFLLGVGAMCMGATTYEWIAANDPPEHWADNYGDRPCWVFTHRDLPPIPGANLRFVAGDVRPIHAQMTEAAAGRDIWVVGGGELAGRFADAGLLDEVIVGIAPVTLGSGAPLLPRRILSDRMRLVEVEQMGQFAKLAYRLS